MRDTKKLSVIVPVYNESRGIEKLINHTKEVLKSYGITYEIVVIDDGSMDNTAKNVAGIRGVRLIRHKYNKGNGATIKTGIRAATGEILLMMDGDGQHDPADIPKILEHTNQYDLVIGARQHELEKLPLRFFGNAILSKIASILTGLKIPDLTSGYRAFRRDIITRYVDMLPNGFSYPTTSTLMFIKAGYDVKFVPIKNLRRKGGISKVRPVQDAVKFFIIIIRIITLFEPLKIFVPISIVFWSIGFFHLIRGVIVYGDVSGTSILSIISGFIIFFFGILADQISYVRRM